MVISGCLLLHFAQIDHAKTSSFCSFQDNNLKIAAQFPLKKNNKSMVFATLSQKRCLKKQTQKHGFSKTPKLPVVDEYLANYKHSWTWSKKPPENKRHTPRGGRRTCYLVLVVVVIAVLFIMNESSHESVMSLTHGCPGPLAHCLHTFTDFVRFHNNGIGLQII